MTLELVVHGLIFMVLLHQIFSLAPECDYTKVIGEIDKQTKYECLISELFDPEKYSALVRPVKHVNETITIEFSIQLSQIVDIDEKNQIMKTNVWLQMYWVDYQLVIDRKRYPSSDIGVIRIRPEHVWKPDIVLFNNADGNYEVSYSSNVLIYDGGYVSWIPPAIYKSSCSIDVQYFPFDEQLCEMKFGSWTFNDKQLNFTFYKGVSHLDVSDYLESGAWDLIEGNANITSLATGADDEYKTMVIFQFVLRRKTLFYTVNLIIPCVLISFVTVSVFILPADAGEKITLCISILLALVVFLLLISKILPPALTIPLVSQYLLFTFIMNIIAVAATVFVINRNYRTPRTHQMPYWVRLVFLNYLPRLLLMKRPDHDERWSGEDKDSKQKTKLQQHKVQPTFNRPMEPDLTHTGPTSVGEPYVETHHPNCRLNTNVPTDEQRQMETTFINTPPVLQMPQEIYKAAESLKFIVKHLKKDDEYHEVLEDWRYVARVIDKLLLCVFLTVTFGGTFGLLMKAPHILESVNQQDIVDVLNRAWSKAKAES